MLRSICKKNLLEFLMSMNYTTTMLIQVNKKTDKLKHTINYVFYLTKTYFEILIKTNINFTLGRITPDIRNNDV